VAGGELPWILTAGSGSIKSDGQLRVRVRGLVLARQAPVPPALQGTNPFPDFRALVSYQSIGAGNTATVVNVSTGVWVPKTVSIHATWVYSWIRPPSVAVTRLSAPTGIRRPVLSAGFRGPGCRRRP
jgi:hypothetical protein